MNCPCAPVPGYVTADDDDNDDIIAVLVTLTVIDVSAVSVAWYCSNTRSELPPSTTVTHNASTCAQLSLWSC